MNPNARDTECNPVLIRGCGDLRVVRCQLCASPKAVDALRSALRRCRARGVCAVVLEIDPRLTLSDKELSGIAAAVSEFRAHGGELVTAVERRALRRAIDGLFASRAPFCPSAFEFLRAKRAGLSLRHRWGHRFSFTATPDELPFARRRVLTLAEVAGLGEPALFEFGVAATEALTNAVIHGSPRGHEDCVRVEFLCFKDEIAVEVIDSGAGDLPFPALSPGVSATNGRGIPFMNTLCDVVQFARSACGTHVLLVKSLRSEDDADEPR